MIGRQLCTVLVLILAMVLAACSKHEPAPGSAVDEALQAGRRAESFPAADEDYFKDMDGGVELTANEIHPVHSAALLFGSRNRP